MHREIFRKPDPKSKRFNNKSKIDNYTPNIYVILAYFSLVLVITYPLIFKINRYILGSFGGYRDLSWELWLHWFVKDSISNLNSLYFTDIAHYPIGLNVLVNNANFLNPILSSLLQVIFNLTTSYNILCFLALTLNGFSPLTFSLVGYLLPYVGGLKFLKKEMLI